MLAVTAHGEKDIRVEDVAKPGLEGPTDAIVRVTTSALCGSDMHIYHGKIPAVPDGWIVGHEFCGVVEDIGDGVNGFDVGDRVVAAMYTACGTCPACVAGSHRNCPHFAMFGFGQAFGNLQGGQAEFVRVPLADMTLRKIPAGVTDESIIFTGDILATAFTALRQAGTTEGDTIGIVGAGPVGQLLAMCAPIFGVARTFIVDIVPERLVEASAWGAIPIDANDENPHKRVKEETGGAFCDQVFEAVGNVAGMETAFSLPKANGTVALVGMLVDEQLPISAGNMWLRNLTVVPILGAPFAHRDQLLGLIAAGRIDPGVIVSDRMPLTDAADVYRAFDAKEISKAVFEVSA